MKRHIIFVIVLLVGMAILALGILAVDQLIEDFLRIKA